VKTKTFSFRLFSLLAGDALAFALVTIFGFASHGLLETVGLRILTTFLPILAAWLLVAPHLGAFDTQLVLTARQLWRPLWAIALAAPLAAFLRGVWLGTPVQPVFVAVLAGVNGLAILIWRVLYILLATRMKQSHG
jgi:hypothetical protein